MLVREPIVAGRFYDADTDRCRESLRNLLDESNLEHSDSSPVAGLVPHAGWMCSGAVAAMVFKAIAKAPPFETIVLFGGVHRHRGNKAAMFGEGRWETPLGPIEVDARLAERALGQTNLLANDPFAHEQEHSIEVQMPFIRYLFPDAAVLPVMIPPGPAAPQVGEAIGRTLTTYQYKAVVIGTTDLTHYGPAYRFTPKGIGPQAHEWAKTINDTRFIDLVCKMQEDQVVAEATEHRNACSSGAAAATIAAAKFLGATKGTVLEHTTSSEVLSQSLGSTQDDSVGYAGIVFS